MKTDRRGFFGVAAGAVAAVPVAAQQLNDSLAHTTAHAAKMSGSLGGSAQVEKIGSTWDSPIKKDSFDQVNHLKNQITKYLGFIKETENEVRDIEYREFSYVEAQRIDGLKSVSPSFKAMKMIEFKELMDKKRRLTELNQSMEYFKKELGLLGHLI